MEMKREVEGHHHNAGKVAEVSRSLAAQCNWQREAAQPGPHT